VRRSYASGVLFDMQVTDHDGTEVVTVVGDVDLAGLPRLHAALESRAERVVVDLRAVDWFDPVCLGVLLAANLRATRRGGSLTVVATAAVAEMLADTGVDQVLAVTAAPPG